MGIPPRRRVVGSLLIGLPLLLAAVSSGQAPPSQQSPSIPPAAYQALSYRLIGPYRGGRSVAVAGVPDEPNTYYMGSTGGGVWKTTNAGATWVNVSDGFFRSGSIGSIAVAASDKNVIYVGTGEACLRGNISAGDGVYKSQDAGRTWKHIGLQNAGQISRVRVDPRDADMVYAAALGHAFGDNQDRGIFRSRDGGATWKKVLYVSDKAGAADLALDVTNPRVLYAAIWEAVRKPWTFISGGPGSGLYKTTDGGETWIPLTEGLPRGLKGRMGITVSAANPQRVWTIIEAAEGGGIYRSDDGGAHFVRVNGDRRFLARPFYYMHIFADPRDANKVYICGHGDGFVRSADGGVNWESLRAPHGDYHDLWINPTNTDLMIDGNDGGATVSLDGGRTWSSQRTQPTAELYRVTTDNQFFYRLYGAQQDNTTVSIPSRTTDVGITERDWYAVGGGEQGHIAVNPTNPNIVYAGSYEGIIERYDHATGQVRNILAYPQFGEGRPARDFKYRFQMNAPIRVSPHDPTVLYHTSNVVHRSTNEGQSWTVVSPDLTRNDKSKQDWAGGPITHDHTGPETYCTIFAFEESPIKAGVLWAGSDDGLVHVSRDNGGHWDNVTPPTMPEWGTVNMIDPSPHDPARTFIAVHRYRDDDFHPYVFRTNDYGRTWTLLTNGTNGIPSTHFVRVVREDPVRKGLLYAGTEYGMYASFNEGATWQSMQLNLPVVPITDIVVKHNDLAIATQGRSFWILDDLSPLRQLTPAVAVASTHLFKPADPFRVESRGRDHLDVPGVAKNPPNGVIVDFELGRAPNEPVVLEFLEGQGRLIKRYATDGSDKGSRLEVKAGMNRFVWDLRYPDVVPLEGVVIGRPPRGPKAVPGSYKVRLTVGQWSDTQTFELKPDPRLSTTAADYSKQFELASEIAQRFNTVHATVKDIREARGQVESLEKRAAAVQPSITEAARAVSRKLTEIEESLIDTKLQAVGDIINYGPGLDLDYLDLYDVVLSADARPTDGSQERFNDLDAQLSGSLKKLEELIRADVAELNRKALDAKLPAVAIAPMVKSSSGLDR
jgi:photosystem II stability/assembly factor-like uncharacterized protein